MNKDYGSGEIIVILHATAGLTCSLELPSIKLFQIIAELQARYGSGEQIRK